MKEIFHLKSVNTDSITQLKDPETIRYELLLSLEEMRERYALLGVVGVSVLEVFICEELAKIYAHLKS